MADPYLRDDARGRIHALHAEREMQTSVRAAFRQYLAAAEAAVLDRKTSGNVTAADEPDLNLWPPPHIWRRLVTIHIVPTWRRIFARAFGRFLRRDQRARIATEDYVQAYLEDATQRLTGSTWPDEVYDAVREQIRQGLANNETRRQLRRRVRQVLGPDQWTGRANTIARTESLAALNGGAYRAGLARQEVFGERLYKRWIATDDHRTRPAHRLADGQTVPADQPFHVGGEEIAFPHDPRGRPDNTINCRCVLTWHADDELEDEPVDITAASHMPGNLKRYWTRGKGALKIRWGQKNDFYRCRRHLRKYVPDHMVDGLCANLHKRALGVWPGQERTKADAGGCPCEDMTDEQIEEALAPMLDDPEITAELNQDEDQAEHDDPTEPDATSADDEGVWEVPADDEVADEDLVIDGEEVTAADFTPSGGPTAAKRKRAEKNKAALPGGRFPIENTSDLRKAISALGRAKGGDRGRAAVKAHIIRRAKALGATNMLPESWRSGGAQKTAASAATSANSWYELVAERVPDHPPADWFTDPELTGPTKIRVREDGRVFGHIAAWDTEHASLPGVTARMFADDQFHRFHRHPVRTADGTRVRTGPLATGGHASTEDPRIDLTAAQAHYDRPEFVAADVVAGKDQHGIWCSGALRPGISPFQVMLLDRYSISGDWRNGELVAACSVSVPGFHLDDDANVMALAADAGPERPTLGDHRPRARFEDDGHPTALVAAGVVTDQPTVPKVDGWELFRQFQAAAQAHQDAEQARRSLVSAVVAGAAQKMSRLRVR